MGGIFKASEVVELGVLIEENGEAFYNSLKKSAKNNAASNLFGYLAEEERKHRATFQKMIDSVSKYAPPESYPGEYDLYMKSLADDNVFTKRAVGEAWAKKADTDLKAINMALVFEKDSIIFFDGMKRFVPQAEHKTIDGLIDQEREHIIKLTDLKKTV
jgi:rubrerythrin